MAFGEIAPLSLGCTDGQRCFFFGFLVKDEFSCSNRINQIMHKTHPLHKFGWIWSETEHSFRAINKNWKRVSKKLNTKKQRCKKKTFCLFQNRWLFMLVRLVSTRKCFQMQIPRRRLFASIVFGEWGNQTTPAEIINSVGTFILWTFFHDSFKSHSGDFG